MGQHCYDLVRERSPGLVEAEFVDNVRRHLKRGEFLLLIIGDGIREGVEEIVDFVQRHSGLHFNLALVEAALYRDTAERLIIQSRVLARTELVQRFVVDGGVGVETSVTDADGEQEPLSQQEEENRRFWTAVLQNPSFADATVEVPKAPTTSWLKVRVRNSGHSGWALWFTAYVYRSKSVLGCFMSCRKGEAREKRIFGRVVDSLEEVRREVRPSVRNRDPSWEDLEEWREGGRPRIGFRQRSDMSFLAGLEDSDEYLAAASWMWDRLNRLVSVLHPRLQEMLAED